MGKKTVSPEVRAIAYEILRRNDGLVALSCNYGLLASTPAWVTQQNSGLSRNLTLLDQDKRAIAKLSNLPADVIEQIKKTSGIHFMQFLPAALFSEDFLRLA